MNTSVINKETIEFEVADKHKAVNIRREISELTATKIPRIIDAVFSKYFSGNDLHRIERIEIDLGTIGFGNLEEEFTERFHKLFENEIIKYSSGNMEFMSPVEKVLSVESDFELLMFFITTGSLPWWAAHNQEVKIDEILGRIIKEDKNKLLELLNGIAPGKIFISRIVSQFSTASIKAFNLLLKDSYESLKLYYDLINDFFYSELKQLISKYSFERILFESLISYLPQRREVKVKTEFLVIEFIERIVCMESLTLSKVKSIFQAIMNSEIFKVLPNIHQVKKLIGIFFTSEEININQNIPALIEQIKELISGRTLKETTFNEKTKESDKQPASFEKEKLLQHIFREEREMISEQTGKISSLKKEKIESAVTKKNEDIGKPQTVKDGKTITEEKELVEEIPARTNKKILQRTDDKNLKTEENGVNRKFPARERKNAVDELHQNEIERISELKIKREIDQTIDEKFRAEDISGKKILEYPFKKNITDKGEASAIPEKEEKLLRKNRFNKYLAEKIYINNSGLVLIAIYIPAFFKSLGLVENNMFKNDKAAEHGVHLLQYLVNEEEQPPEYILALNKILCGLDLSYPVSKSIKITKREKEETDNLLNSIIKNWDALKNTSAEGFRNSFLIRNGIIANEENQFNLKVERKPYDILLDKLPWSFSIIKHSWMNKPVYVEW